MPSDPRYCELKLAPRRYAPSYSLELAFRFSMPQPIQLFKVQLKMPPAIIILETKENNNYDPLSAALMCHEKNVATETKADATGSGNVEGTQNGGKKHVSQKYGQVG